MSDHRHAQLKRLLESGAGSLQPLTFPQRELWEASHVPPGDVSNHICAFVEVKGVIAPEMCQDCVQLVLDRQEAMRASILPGKGAPMQFIRSACAAETACVDLPPHQHSAEAVEEVMREIFLRPFDMVRGPLYRVVMLRRAVNDILLVFTIHHAIADGWSLGVLIQDLCAAWVQILRAGKKPLPPVPMSCSQWGAAERSFWQPAEIAAHADFWKQQLADLPTLWPAAAETRPVSFILRRSVDAIPIALAQETRELAKRTGTTLFTTLLTAFQVTLGKWAGTQDVVVGTPVANRARTSVRESIGYCSGNVPLRARIDPAQTFAAAHQATHHSALDAFAHAVPFAELIRIVDQKPAAGRSPIYEVRFALQNHPVPEGNAPGLSMRLRMRSTGTARFALGCEITEEGNALEVVWLARPDVVPHEETERLHRLFIEVLANACRDSSTRIGQLTP